MFKKPWLTIIFSLIIFTVAANLQPAAAQAPPANACIVAVFDESSSMLDNDPGYIRNLAGKLFIALLDSGDRVGVIRFASTATALTPELVTLDDPAGKEALLSLLNDTPPEGYTDLLAALQEAGRLLEGGGCDSLYIVLLSDGAPVLEGGLPAGYIEHLLSLVRDLNVPIFAIALTAGGETGLLYQLAQATNPAGFVLPARTSGDLLDAYLDVLAHLKDRAILGTDFAASPGFAPLTLEPALAPYISRTTFIVAKPAGVNAILIGPGGESVAPGDPRLAFSVASDPRFAVYTIDDPAPGDWGFALDGPGQVQARAILRSRLRVKPVLPAAFHPLGQPMLLAAQLIEEDVNGNTITLIGTTAFTALIQRPDDSQEAIDILYEDGSHGDHLAGDGIFSNQYVNTDLPGEYTIHFTGYKGLIPAGQSTRVVVVPFPQPVITSPLEPIFEFRGTPLPLEMRLEGGDPPILDNGNFIVQVTDPSGQVTELPLAQSGNNWSAGFVPEEEGPHTIAFLPQGASYKGVPYNLSAGRAVEVRLVPSISISSATPDLGTVERGDLSAGLPLELAVISSSPDQEPLTFDLAGLPGPAGLAISTVFPERVPPGESTLFLTISGDVAPGDYRLNLLPAARQGVELNSQQIPLNLTVYQPAFILPAGPLDLGDVRIDRLEKGVEFVLSITSASRKEESLSLAWLGPEGFELESEVETIPAGQTVEVPFTITGQGLALGGYLGQIRVEGREGLVVEPGSPQATINIVPVPWCARYCAPLIGGTLLAIGLTAVGYNRLKGKPRAAGALTPKRVPPNQLLPPLIPLRAGFGKSRIIVGSKRGSDIQLLEGGVQPAHAAIHIGRAKVMEAVGRPPKMIQVERTVSTVENLGSGLVKVNGAPVPKGQSSAALQNGATIVFGQYEFKYDQ